MKIWSGILRYFREILLKNKGFLIFHENQGDFTIGFPIIMKISPKTSSNFHASRINEYFFEAPDLIPSPEITLGSIVYGKITQTALADVLEHFSGVLIFC